MCNRRVTRYRNQRIYKAIIEDNNQTIMEHIFPSNFIKTSRYTALDFLPMALLIQFSKIANVYFLIVAVLQSLPSISPLSPFTAIAPLIFVITVSMVREGLEDLARHKSDQILNSSLATKIVDGEREIQISWADIEVGDIIKVNQNEPFPADLIMLGSSYNNGVCYIETGALDGEKNLKPKNSLQESYSVFNEKPFNKEIILNISAEPPSQALYQFQGTGELFFKGDKRQLGFSAKQLLLRGAFLRNTEWIVGVVVYTGLDTKIMMNAEQGKVKTSDMEHTMNQYIIGVFILQLMCAVISCALAMYWNKRNYEKISPTDSKEVHKHWYLQETDSPNTIAALRFGTYFLLYNTMIPISLIVSLEMVKVAQSYFITKDEDMYVKAKDRWPNVMTSTINEELGQVEYVFSDKTGTLTCNVMQFKLSVIGNTLYGHCDGITDKNENFDIAIRDPLINKQEQTNTDTNNIKIIQDNNTKKEHSLTEFVFYDDRMDKLLSKQNNQNEDINPAVDLVIKSKDGYTQFPIKNQSDLAFEYWTLLAAAHECIVQKQKDVDPNDYTKIMYQGPSPDEITLVDAAKHMGFIFLGSSAKTIDLVVQGQKRELEFFYSFEFDSARKRMSVIVKDNGVYKLLIKGADNIIKLRLDKDIVQPFLENADKQLNRFSLIGLRTLMMAMRVLSQQEFDQIQQRYKSLQDSVNKEDEIKQLADDIEKDLFLLGATAVEDKLQDNVPETISDLLKANIKTWMLTGDKLETAENIAKSCKLIQDDMTIITVSEKEENMLRNNLLGAAMEKYQKCLNDKKKKSFLIEGESLAIVFNVKELKDAFIEITQGCESVVCCRVTPKQKAEVVRTIKVGLNKICLAIGDGANDVNMIQEAQIGCGIYGNEGMRAVQASDFAFGEFQCLWKLLLVHGRWSYIRISEMIVYFFYKNMIFTIPQFYFAFFAAYGGQTIFDDYYVSLYNLVFTALPLIARAIFDQDVNFKKQQDNKIHSTVEDSHKFQYVKKKFPMLYYTGQQKTMFSFPIFVNWIVQGVAHGAILFFSCYGFLQNHILNNNGHSSGLWTFSLIIYSSIILLANLKLSLYTKYWTTFNFIAVWITSLMFYFAFLVATEEISSSYAYSTPLMILSSIHYWLIMGFSVGAIFAFDLAVLYVIKLTINSKSEILLKLIKRQQQKDPFKERSISQDNSFIHSYFDLMKSVNNQQDGKNKQTEEQIELQRIEQKQLEKQNELEGQNNLIKQSFKKQTVL